jgi:hypothetical protein
MSKSWITCCLQRWQLTTFHKGNYAGQHQRKTKRYASADRDSNIWFKFGPHKTVSLSATRQAVPEQNGGSTKLIAPQTNKSIFHAALRDMSSQ